MVFARNALDSGPGKASNSIAVKSNWGKVRVKIGKYRFVPEVPPGPGASLAQAKK
jgi:hypothetical protein